MQTEVDSGKCWNRISGKTHDSEPGGREAVHPEGFQARPPGSTLGETCHSSSLLVNPKVDKQFPVSLLM